MGVGWRVAAWGLILGRLTGVVRVAVAVVVVVTLAVSDGRLVFASGVVEEVGVVSVPACEGCGIPVNAVQISAIGGSSSNQGIVKSGLSHRLWVLGSS